MKKIFYAFLGIFLCVCGMQAQEKKDVEVVTTATIQSGNVTPQSKESTNSSPSKAVKKIVDEDVICNFTYLDEMKARSRGDVALSEYKLKELRKSVAKMTNVVESSVFIIRTNKGIKGKEYEVCSGGVYYSYVPGKGFGRGKLN
ncbi:MULTISPECIES: hypothetical protein [unclassified Myroides]|uniref:hypothetical protein n=1 Tax=unclassified Myroides TaxID=2642485 RepID=UPI0015FCBE01|nr:MULTISPECIES: hypothetical protein [unclassified Myroides]MBB1150865.1 hypothetical protein [Myroides sp. NP-2]MDM1407817.1 hypothetical protein [Myroides sp. DF42-4-2]